MARVELLERIEAHVRRHDLIEPGGEVTCLVSGGADSTCLWHALRELGYGVSAVHVNHGLRGEESEADAAFCRDVLGAEVIVATPASTEAELRDLRYSLTGGLRATGHTSSDQVETVVYRLAASGSTRGIKPKREDGVVRPLLTVWREETEAYCRAHGLAYRTDSTNPDTLRGLIREQLVPLLRQLHPAAEQNIARLADERPRLPRHMEDTLLELLATQGRHEGGRPRRRNPRDPRVRPDLAGARPCPLGPVDDRVRRAGARGARPPARRSARGTPQEAPGRLRGRKGSSQGAGLLACRRA